MLTSLIRPLLRDGDVVPRRVQHRRRARQQRRHRRAPRPGMGHLRGALGPPGRHQPLRRWWCTAVLRPMMQQRWGKIVFISSGNARIGDPGISVAYNASKAGLIGLTIGLSVHLEVRHPGERDRAGLHRHGRADDQRSAPRTTPPIRSGSSGRNRSPEPASTSPPRAAIGSRVPSSTSAAGGCEGGELGACPCLSRRSGSATTVYARTRARASKRWT